MSRREQNSLLATVVLAVILGVVLHHGIGSWFVTIGWAVVLVLTCAHWFYIGMRHFLDKRW